MRAYSDILCKRTMLSSTLGSACVRKPLLASQALKYCRVAHVELLLLVLAALAILLSGLAGRLLLAC